MRIFVIFQIINQKKKKKNQSNPWMLFGTQRTLRLCMRTALKRIGTKFNRP